MERIVALWNGRLPLANAFWEYAIVYGTLANVVATIGAFAALTLGLPGAVAVAVYLLPLPYVAAAVVGVYRSARRYTGHPPWARAAEVTVVIWAVLMVLV